LNEAACGGGRYAWARSNVFPSQPISGSIGPVMIAKRLFANLGFIQVEELLLTQGVRLLSLRTASAANQQTASFKPRYRKSSATDFTASDPTLLASDFR
jgi:hypothetical protein